MCWRGSEGAIIQTAWENETVVALSRYQLHCSGTSSCCFTCCLCSAVTRQLDMPTLVLHGDADVALGVELLDGIDAAVPDVSEREGKACKHTG